MADQGFEKPAYLHLKGDKNYLELAVREMKAMTKGGANAVWTYSDSQM